MAQFIVPTPRALHNRATFGQSERTVAELPFFKLVNSCLVHSGGEGYTVAQIQGVSTKELVVVAINDDSFYEQALYTADHLWECGYWISFVGSRVPGKVGPAPTGPTLMYVCWDPQVLRNRGIPCPCWCCASPMHEKFDCVGCPKYTTYAKQLQRR